jgi:hypothetical protein
MFAHDAGRPDQPRSSGKNGEGSTNSAAVVLPTAATGETIKNTVSPVSLQDHIENLVLADSL